jgi:polysaccharide export outer membrane protein
MSNRNFQVSAGRGTLARVTKMLLVGVLATRAIGGCAVLKAQDAAGAAPPAPAASLTPMPSAGSSSVPASDNYLLCPDDVLDVFVYDVPELSHTYNVSSSGVVSVPLLPAPIQAAGLTPDQFARSMEEAFRQSGRLRRPEIAVSLRQSRSLFVTVDGAVRNPQVLPMPGRTRLVDVLTQSGGIGEDAGNTLTISRGPLALRDLAAEGELATPNLTIDLKKLSDGADPASKISVWPGDRVTVQRGGVFYVLGEVKTPGGYTLKNGRDELTVLRALALAGDITGVAKKSKAVIIRRDLKAPQGRDEIKLDLKQILDGKSPDPVLQANDIVFVPGSGGKKALKAIEGAPAMALGSAGGAALILH